MSTQLFLNEATTVLEGKTLGLLEASNTVDTIDPAHSANMWVSQEISTAVTIMGPISISLYIIDTNTFSNSEVKVNIYKQSLSGDTLIGSSTSGFGFDTFSFRNSINVNISTTYFSIGDRIAVEILSNLGITTGLLYYKDVDGLGTSPNFILAQDVTFGYIFSNIEYYPGSPDNALTYGRFLQTIGSTYKYLDPSTLEFSSSGAPKIRKISSNPVKEFTVEHILSPLEKDVLLMFYSLTKTSKFYLFFKLLNTYSYCKFSSPPSISILAPDSSLFRVTCNIIEV